MRTKNETKPGPKENRLKVNGDWKLALSKALKKKRPKEKWQKAQINKRDSKK